MSKIEKITDGSLINSNIPSLDTFLETGTSPVHIGKYPCFVIDDRDIFLIFLITASGKIHYWGYFGDTYYHQGDKWYRYRPDAVLIGSKGSFSVINNADGDYVVDCENGVTLSFNLLMRLCGYGKIDQLIAALRSNEVHIVDSTKDEYKNLTDNEKELLKKGQMIKSSVPGFSLVRSMWHRSASVLLECKGTSYLFGQDEDTYFGCELTDHPKTVRGAFVSLIPVSLRKRRDIKRQGEWFVVPVAKTKVPATNSCLVLANHSIVLPIDDPDSNEHVVLSHDIRITSEGVYAINGHLEHNDHETIAFSGWCMFVKNTAIRSMSQEGVD